MHRRAHLLDDVIVVPVDGGGVLRAALFDHLHRHAVGRHHNVVLLVIRELRQRVLEGLLDGCAVAVGHI